MLALAGCGGGDESVESAGPAEARTEAADTASELAGVKRFLGDHTDRLAAFTKELDQLSSQYADLARQEDGDLAALWAARADEVRPLLEQMKTAWIEGNPAYERVEGIVAGTPSSPSTTSSSTPARAQPRIPRALSPST